MKNIIAAFFMLTWIVACEVQDKPTAPGDQLTAADRAELQALINSFPED